MGRVAEQMFLFYVALWQLELDCPRVAQRGASAESRGQFGNALSFCICDDIVSLSEASVTRL